MQSTAESAGHERWEERALSEVSDTDADSRGHNTTRSGSGPARGFRSAAATTATSSSAAELWSARSRCSAGTISFPRRRRSGSPCEQRFSQKELVRFPRRCSRPVSPSATAPVRSTTAAVWRTSSATSAAWRRRRLCAQHQRAGEPVCFAEQQRRRLLCRYTTCERR